jgi:predicted  nucleic acid-binding Zn-ribbon protein
MPLENPRLHEILMLNELESSSPNLFKITSPPPHSPANIDFVGADRYRFPERLSMLGVIEKLLILQDRDRKISHVRAELANIEPQRLRHQAQLAEGQNALDAAKLRLKQLESERKRLELEVEGKKQQIEKYSLQQFQTKKNDEYRALASEIDTCKAEIRSLEDQQLELMEQAEGVQKEAAAASQSVTETKKRVEGYLADLASREQALQKEMADLEAGYEQLEASVADDSILARYKRLRRQRGERTVVGIEHSVCGGCHMKLPTQIVMSCRGAQDLVCCPNCGRILYYTPHMDLAVAE